MKKVIPLFLVILTLCSCSAKIYTPVINQQFDLNAVYKTGDFSYNCRIVKDDKKLSVTALSSYAKGTTISFDGKTVTYEMKDMKKDIDASVVDKTNPAIVLYEVFKSLENADTNHAVKDKNTFCYTGKTSVGDFVFIQNTDNSFNSLEIKEADISVKFN